MMFKSMNVILLIFVLYSGILPAVDLIGQQVLVGVSSVL